MKRSTILFLSVILLALLGFGLKISADGQLPTNPPHAADELVIESRICGVVLKTANGCGIGNFLIPSTGDPSQGIPPMLGSRGDAWTTSAYHVLDTLPGTHIKGVAFKRSYYLNTSIISALGPSEPYVVVTDTGMFSYQVHDQFSAYQNTIYALDSVFIPSILKMAKQITTDESNPIVLLVEDATDDFRIRFYGYPDLQEQFSFPFHVEPEIFEVVENSLFITGLDTTGSNMLYHFSAVQDTLYATYPLNDSSANAQEFIQVGNTFFILSSPGDSMTVLTAINSLDSSVSQTVVYATGGARATYNEFRNDPLFTFQPNSAVPDSLLDRQILVLDPVTGLLDTLMINHKLDQFKHPEIEPNSFGQFSMTWMGVKSQPGMPDTVYFADEYGSSATPVQTHSFPRYINATYGCWFGMKENELEDIQFNIYPNPASLEAVISLSGIKKGRTYKLSITDISGRVHHTTAVEAYQEIKLPVADLPPGVYLLNLETGKNVITRKLVVQ